MYLDKESSFAGSRLLGRKAVVCSDWTEGFRAVPPSTMACSAGNNSLRLSFEQVMRR